MHKLIRVCHDQAAGEEPPAARPHFLGCCPMRPLAILLLATLALATPEKKKYPGNTKNRRLAEACRIIKRQYPELFIAVYSHMQSTS